MQKIRPFLWFDTEAEEAAKLYTSVFKNAKLGKAVRHGDAGPGPKGRVMSIEFELEGLEFIALNGGPHFKFNEAISLVVDCTSQAEVDDLWEKLAAGGAVGVGQTTNLGSSSRSAGLTTSALRRPCSSLPRPRP